LELKKVKKISATNGLNSSIVNTEGNEQAFSSTMTGNRTKQKLNQTISYDMH